MEAATIVTLPTATGTAPAAPGAATVVVDGERILVTDLVLVDHSLATFVAGRDVDERAALVERALKIGLTALQDVGVTVNVDVVRAEFEKIVGQTQLMNQRAAEALEQTLRTNFADGEGRLPRTLEKFLGDRGELNRFVGELFDESKRDSAIGRINALLGTYFDGDASKLAHLLDPTRANSPLHQFSQEVRKGFDDLKEQIVRLEAAAGARAQERKKSAARGADFEVALEEHLGEIARGLGDLVERTGTTQGDEMRSKKGDFVITINPEITRGLDLRIVVEAKAASRSVREIREELRQAKTNRSAVAALAVFSPDHAPSGVAPFDFRFGDAYCVVDPEAPDRTTLEAGVRLARLLALLTLKEQQVEVDADAIRTHLTGVRTQLDVIKGMKATLTTIGNSAQDVSGKLDTMRDGILAGLVQAETELSAAK